MVSSSSASYPVVAITIALSASTTCWRCSTVASGLENSMTTSALSSTSSSAPVMTTPVSPMPATTPTSLPICGCSGYSIAPTSSISVCWVTPWVISRPIRPHAPLIITRIIYFPLVIGCWLLGRSAALHSQQLVRFAAFHFWLLVVGTFRYAPFLVVG